MGRDLHFSGQVRKSARGVPFRGHGEDRSRKRSCCEAAGILKSTIR